MQIELVNKITSIRIGYGDIIMLENDIPLLVTHDVGDQFKIVLIDLNSCELYDSYTDFDLITSYDGYINGKKILEIIKSKNIKISRV